MNNEEKILSLLVEMNGRLGTVEKEIAGVKQDVSGIKQKLEEHDKRFADLEQDISNIKGQQEENTGILRALEHRAEENSAKLEGLTIVTIKEFGAVRGELIDYKEEVRQEFKIVNTKLDGLELGYKEHDYAINRIKTKII